MEMDNGIDTIHMPGQYGLDELDHGDDLGEYQSIVVTESGSVYGTDENIDNDYIREATGEDPFGFYAHGDERGSLKARRATDTEFDQALSMTESPFAVLNGQLQARHGQSTGAVTEEEVPVDQSPTAGRYGLDKVVGD